MIETASEFHRLRTSHSSLEYQRAAQEEAPLKVWQEVLKQYPDMAIWVAHNKTVPLEILEQLATHPNQHVRSAVATKNKLQEPLLLQLATDSDETVRMGVARHKNATELVLTRLVDDSWSEISQLARARIAIGQFI
jgi:hypothetical protein